MCCVIWIWCLQGGLKTKSSSGDMSSQAAGAAGAAGSAGSEATNTEQPIKPPLQLPDTVASTPVSQKNKYFC